MKLNKVFAACMLSYAIANPALANSIRGQIVSESGDIVTNAEIKIKGESQPVYSDDKGYFVIENLPTGKVELHISAKQYSHATQMVELTASGLTDYEVKLVPTVMEVIDVHATPLHASNIESALPINVLAADELRLKQASTLGESLKNEVGVHSSYFGPVASSPIIRGLDGPRVLVTQNGMDVSDASRVGPDHIVSSEVATATQIEVLRGPATLFYGSGAIGGVVNVVDNRVPTNSDTQLDYMFKHNDVADENEASFALNTGSEKFAVHFDGFWRESNDYDIPGFAELEADHDDHEEEHDEHDEHEGHEEHPEEEKGTLINSAAKAHGFTVGASYLLDNGFVGFSVGQMDREYGIPGHSHAHGEEEHEEHDEHDEHDEHEEESHGEVEELVFGKLKQDRFQLLSDLNFNNQFISRVGSKLAYTDYEHQEIENGEVGTEFKNEMLEARFDVYHKEYNGWNGAWTVHYKDSDFEAVGEEAFTPPSNTEAIAFAWLEEKHFGDVLVQFGARIEHVEISSDAEHHDEDEHHEDEHHDEHEDEHHDEHEGEIAFKDQSFTPISLSASAVWEYQDGYNLGLSAAMSQRAPSAAEIFSNGPHIGTSTYEVGALYEVHEHGDHVDIELGDQDLEKETSYSLDLTWRKFEGDFGFVISAFYNHIEDYYYQQNTGLFAGDPHAHDEEDEHHDEEEHHEDEHHEEEGHDEEHGEEGLPIYVYQQDDVNMYGFESEFIYQLTPAIKMTVFADYIRAKIDGGDNLPRIPPMRYGAEFDYVADNFAANLSVKRISEQDDIADTETSTDGYTMVDANFNYYLNGFGDDLVLFVKGENLTDEDARVHTSFLKNVSPLPGRAFSVGVRGSF